MKIIAHPESHIVDLEDGSRWRIFPGDLDVTLGWKPETDLTVILIDDDVASHALLSDSGPVRVISGDQIWPGPEVKEKLADDERAEAIFVRCHHTRN
ncbi:hypothetical protein JQ621_34810 [Bradyrhizobium manausense]|uniref:hypothetical protein n=1 Tax=Bradyrhizobium manausense TaxID=989370 RepID=UPI001BAD1E83|nr:hypothetical protein [Bradyrhizobium manausense]MBR1092645.1 hypothetical protein [Bradyrhizobium manausense]